VQEKDVSAPTPHLNLLVARTAACACFSCVSLAPAHLITSSALLPDMPYTRKCDRQTGALCAQRDGCPKIVNLGSAKTDLFYERWVQICPAGCRAHVGALTGDELCCHLLTPLSVLSLQEKVWVQEKMTPERSGCAALLRNDWRAGRHFGFDEAGGHIRDGMANCCKHDVQQLLSANTGTLLHGAVNMR
jgi:hypothetical protein